MLKETMKMKIMENEMWLKICEVLFYQKISCAKEIAKKIKCNPQQIRSRFDTLEKYEIIESTGIVPKKYLAEKGRLGNFSKFYLLTEMARMAMEEILEKEEE